MRKGIDVERKPKPKRSHPDLPTIPSLPFPLGEIASFRLNELRSVSEILALLESHIRELGEFASALNDVVVTKLTRAETKTFLSGLSRELHGAYYLTRLRYQIWQLLFIYSRLRRAPSNDLLMLIRVMDEPEDRRPKLLSKAIRISARAQKNKESLTTSELARRVGVSRGTIRNWMTSVEWEGALTRDIAGLTNGFPQIKVRPIKIISKKGR
jgi:hypothetical protein